MLNSEYKKLKLADLYQDKDDLIFVKPDEDELYFNSACHSLISLQAFESFKSYHEIFGLCSGRTASPKAQNLDELIDETRQLILKHLRLPTKEDLNRLREKVNSNYLKRKEKLKEEVSELERKTTQLIKKQEAIQINFSDSDIKTKENLIQTKTRVEKEYKEEIAEIMEKIEVELCVCLDIIQEKAHRERKTVFTDKYANFF